MSTAPGCVILLVPGFKEMTIPHSNMDCSCLNHRNFSKYNKGSLLSRIGISSLTILKRGRDFVGVGGMFSLFNTVGIRLLTSPVDLLKVSEILVFFLGDPISVTR